MDNVGDKFSFTGDTFETNGLLDGVETETLEVAVGEDCRVENGRVGSAVDEHITIALAR